MRRNKRSKKAELRFIEKKIIHSNGCCYPFEKNSSVRTAAGIRSEKYLSIRKADVIHSEKNPVVRKAAAIRSQRKKLNNKLCNLKVSNTAKKN